MLNLDKFGKYYTDLKPPLVIAISRVTIPKHPSMAGTCMGFHLSVVLDRFPQHSIFVDVFLGDSREASSEEGAANVLPVHLDGEVIDSNGTP